MKFTIEKAVLLKTLSHVQNIVEKRNTVPVLSNVRIEAGNEGISFKATDMDTEITEIVDAKILENGAITAPAHMLYDIVRKLRKNPQTKRLPVIMVTAKTAEMDMIKGLDDGADDYIKKPFSIMELITRVKALLRRTETEDVKILQMEHILLDHERHMVYVDNQPVELTFKEYELLRLLMTNQNVVLSREVIMRHVWGTEFEGESRTVDMHIKTLRQKLGDAGSKIRTVRNVGYVIE